MKISRFRYVFLLLCFSIQWIFSMVKSGKEWEIYEFIHWFHSRILYIWLADWQLRQHSMETSLKSDSMKKPFLFLFLVVVTLLKRSYKTAKNWFSDNLITTLESELWLANPLLFFFLVKFNYSIFCVISRKNTCFENRLQ